ncbi:MAG: hypothetical protein QUV07_14660, partial [Cyanobium sp. CZS 25K]|nr:hypothetical protein [Cyanobium sp. CZS25K]
MRASDQAFPSLTTSLLTELSHRSQLVDATAFRRSQRRRSWEGRGQKKAPLRRGADKLRLEGSERVAAGQNLFREDEVFVRLVGGG